MTFWILWLIAGLVITDSLVHLIYAFVILPRFENKPLFAVGPSEPPIGGERIEIVTPDGVVLRGHRWKSKLKTSRGLILFCPELSARHWSAQRYCPGLIEAGFDVIAVDFRGQGESETPPGYEALHWPTRHELIDTQTIIDWIRQRPDLATQPLGLFGVSRGASIALVVAGKDSSIRAVACEGAFSSGTLTLYFTLRWAEIYLAPFWRSLIPRWHYELTIWIARLFSGWKQGRRYLTDGPLSGLSQRPVLLIAGECDSYVPPPVSSMLKQKIGSQVEIWTVPNAKHNQARLTAPVLYDQKLIQFFTEHLSSVITTPDPTTVEPRGEIAVENSMPRSAATK